ncbi:MAG: DUF5615 family PIN-like protein [Actinomycetota bacterium]
MRWLLDEMLPPQAAQELVRRGHDAVTVGDVELAGRPDDEVFDYAVADRRLLVTENVADYATMLAQRLSQNRPCVPVLFVLKSSFPRRGSLARNLAVRLDEWARENPNPYIGAHWP